MPYTYYEHCLDRVLYRDQPRPGFMFTRPEFWNGSEWVVDRDKQFNPWTTLRIIDESYARTMEPAAFKEEPKQQGGVIDMLAVDSGDHWLKANRDEVRGAADVQLEDLPAGEPDCGPQASG